MRRKFAAKVGCVLALCPLVCLSASDKTAVDRAKDGAHGASAQGDKNGQNGSMGLNGGHCGNGGQGGDVG